MFVQKFDQSRENIDVTVLTHEHILVAITRDDLKLVSAGHQLFEQAVAVYVGICEYLVVGPGQEKHRCFHVLSMFKVVVGQAAVLGILLLILDGPVT